MKHRRTPDSPDAVPVREAAVLGDGARGRTVQPRDRGAYVEGLEVVEHATDDARGATVAAGGSSRFRADFVLSTGERIPAGAAPPYRVRWSVEGEGRVDGDGHYTAGGTGRDVIVARALDLPEMVGDLVVLVERPRSGRAWPRQEAPGAPSRSGLVVDDDYTTLSIEELESGDRHVRYFHERALRERDFPTPYRLGTLEKVADAKLGSVLRMHQDPERFGVATVKGRKDIPFDGMVWIEAVTRWPADYPSAPNHKIEFLYIGQGGRLTGPTMRLERMKPGAFNISVGLQGSGTERTRRAASDQGMYLGGPRSRLGGIYGKRLRIVGAFVMQGETAHQGWWLQDLDNPRAEVFRGLRNVGVPPDSGVGRIGHFENINGRVPSPTYIDLISYRVWVGEQDPLGLFDQL